ncbi:MULTISPECIES: STAS domain-containing protein [Oceanospirillaceae]|jgi:phospholipid transport system transporter-binding protein|uniref:STAS domain-containing protein n=1 Tax=Oceanospirillaceae TaxID=135620 RepID=UPI000C4CC623|nr:MULTISPECIES: STAS domain-containing protein [Thalassolituus]MAY14203.1 anti-anti-sigma factor [Oceanospirillaceae bacterium]MBU2038059.1 STAS domain-containing protein [Gammaproteobacteria bacterium]PIQ39598.1 MAG: anti-anti-sigma factor [Thalassolituus sp. CG17_big_fil_post_rev_8_21_14_2_50_53_8]MCA6060036.1 STAS domain-containing protein [Thalassolituus sp. ST750PaO-4]MCB2388370.1 STAS domain-containing protein [Thalassolituus alkanivorans]|tara:strand:+ start:67 stop:372 length:306 start_codon:yes stop_codon:yes gene_type:complete
MSVSLTRIDDNRAELAGSLLATTVVSVLPDGEKLIRAAKGQWTLNMAAVNEVSSAGVALLLEWLRCATAAGINLHIENLPEHMKPIISISDLDSLFEPLLA